MNIYRSVSSLTIIELFFAGRPLQVLSTEISELCSQWCWPLHTGMSKNLRLRVFCTVTHVRFDCIDREQLKGCLLYDIR